MQLLDCHGILQATLQRYGPFLVSPAPAKTQQGKELSSCQKSPGDPASKRGRHQGKMQRDLFLLLLPVRFLPPITGLQQTGGESGLVGREATMELGREQLLSER